MANPSLSADCGRCAALCCVSLAFDRSAQFAFDKPAGAPCPHLSRHGQCSIHGARLARGFSGCVGYDCHGAGQRVTQELFGGRSWQEEPNLRRAMFDAFRVMRQIHELRLLLDAAGDLPLPTELAERRSALQAALEPSTGWSLEALRAFERGSFTAELSEFWLSLRAVVPEGEEHTGGRRLTVGG